MALDERMVAGPADRLDRDQVRNPLPDNKVRAQGQPASAATEQSAERGTEFELPPLPVLKPLPVFTPLRPFTPPAATVAPQAPTAGSPGPVSAGRHAAPLEVDDATDGNEAPEVVSDGASAHAPRPNSRPTPGGRAGALTVLVLGASGTVGAAIAGVLAEAGHRLVLQYDLGSATAAPVASLPGGPHLAGGADPADPASIAALIARLDDETGGLDVVIDAVSDDAPTATIDSGRQPWADTWASVLAAQVLGAAATAHAAAAVFRARRRGGRIILVPAHGRPADGTVDLAREAAAAAVAAMGRGLARDLAPHGIGVSTVTAGPAAASGWSPEALAAAVAWLVDGPTGALPGAVFTIES